MIPSLQPKSFVYIQICWRGHVPYGTPNGFRRVDILPSNKYPMGQKGLTLAECWAQMAEPHTAGMLILDADVVIDPTDMVAMWQAMMQFSDHICLAPAKLWPKATGYQDWVWAHRKFGTGPDEWQEDRDDVDTGSFCFSYIPRAVWDGCTGLRNWIFPNVDDNLYRWARDNSIPFKVVRGCNPKHMNF